MWALLIMSCAAAGAIGAYFSLKSAQGWSAGWAFGSGLVAITVWAWITKQPIKPWVAATLFDGIYGLSWLLVLAVLGEQPTWYQIAGAGLVLIGLLIVSINL